MTTMKALWSTIPGNPNLDSGNGNDLTTPDCELTVTELPIPELPPGTVLVRVGSSGVNPSDAANGLKNLFRVSKPNIPGRDFAGVVHASNSTHLPPGTAVYGTSGNSLSFALNGTAAEYALVPEEAVALKPRRLSVAQAGAVGVPYTTALLALEATNTKPSDNVLVLGGTGSVGRAAARIARCWGCTVVTTARRENAADINIVTDPHLHTIKDHLIRQLGSSDAENKPDVIIDTIGSASLMGEAMKILAPRGRYCVLAGFKGEPPEYQLNLLDLYRNNHAISGINSITRTPDEMGERMRRLAVLFDEQGLEPLAEDELTLVPLERAAEAYQQAMQFTGKKHVIVFDS